MRTVWGVLTLLVMATVATVAVRVGIPSSDSRLPGPVTVIGTSAGVGPAATPTGGGSNRSPGSGRPVKVVTPDRPVSSLLPPIGSDAREAEQLKSAGQPGTPALPVSPATDR